MRASRATCLALAFLALIPLGCALTQRATPAPTATPVRQAEASPTSLPPTEAEPTAAEPAPTATEVTPTEAPATATAASTAEPTEDTEGCAFDADYVADVTIPDDTTLEAGSAFVKTWRMRNSGTCAWGAGTKLAFDSGDHMNGPDAVTVGAVSEGATVDVSVNLEAPTTPGTYRGDWQMETPEGTRFGSVIYVQIVVPEPTEEPTEMPEGCVPPHPDLEPLLDLAEERGYGIGCPTAEGYTIEENGSTGALQAFWANVEEENSDLRYRSLMIWRADTRQIYVIDGVATNEIAEGTLMVYTDTWEEGQPHVPPDCEEMTPPEGYRLPERGFGEVWCQEGLVDTIGWPAEAEIQVDLLAQPTEHGVLMKASGADVNYLILLMPDAGQAVVTQAAQE